MTTSERPEFSDPPVGREAPAHDGRTATGAATGATSVSSGRRDGHRSGASTVVVAAALLVGLLAGGAAVVLVDRYRGGADDPFGGAIQDSSYQAVILSNDKVYFGRLRAVSDDFYQLRPAYFLRETRKDAQSQPVRALMPVTQELHGPENAMLIRAEEIVVVENLDEDSAVLAELRRQIRDDE